MDISKKHWKDLYREQIKIGQCYCYLCGKKIKSEEEFSIDHSTPLCRMGENSSNNWRPSHKSCNNLKGALTYEEYREWIRLENIRNGGKLR